MAAVAATEIKIAIRAYSIAVEPPLLRRSLEKIARIATTTRRLHSDRNIAR
jgi:hypothetical protein